MEKFVTLLIPALVALVLVRLLLMPMKLIFKVGIHSGCGFLCLWLLEFRGGVHGGVFPHQRRDGAGGRIPGTAGDRRHGAAGSAVDVNFTEYRPPQKGVGGELYLCRFKLSLG